MLNTVKKIKKILVPWTDEVRGKKKIGAEDLRIKHSTKKIEVFRIIASYVKQSEKKIDFTSFGMNLW